LFPTYAKNICSLLSVQNIVHTLRCTKWRFSSCKKRENFAPCCRICSEGWIFVCDHVIRLRLSVQIIKLDFAIPALAHTWRVTRKGRFSEGGQGYGGVRRGRVSWRDQRRPAAIPYLLRDILRVNWRGQPRVVRYLANFDHFTCGTCTPAAVAIRNTIAADKFAFDSDILITMLFDDVRKSKTYT